MDSEPAAADSQPPSIDALWRERMRALGPAEKTAIAFALADFALQQKRLILQEEHPDCTAEQVEREARRLVFGVDVASVQRSSIRPS